ncbi:hypothetical protein DPMN_089666, partial [Dreissena polymorpha]
SKRAREAVEEYPYSLDKKRNKPRAAAALSDEEIEKLDTDNILGATTPKSLMNTIWLNNCLNFGLRGTHAQYNLSPTWQEDRVPTTYSRLLVDKVKEAAEMGFGIDRQQLKKQKVRACKRFYVVLVTCIHFILRVLNSGEIVREEDTKRKKEDELRKNEERKVARLAKQEEKKYKVALNNKKKAMIK